MRTIDFIIQETLRRTRKSVAGVSYILLAVSIFVAAETFNKALRDKTKEELLSFGANIIVQPTGQAFDLHSGTVMGELLLPEAYAEKIRGVSHGKMLVAVSPKLYQRFEVDGHSVLVAGITLEERKAKRWWMIDNEVLPNFPLQEREVLLGHHVASRMGGAPAEVKLGDDVFRVRGVLDETGSPDDFMAFVKLGSLQDLSGKQGMVSLFEVSTSCIACKEMNINDVAEEIDEALPADAQVLLVRQIAEAQMGTLRKVQGFTTVSYLVVLTLCIFLLVNFMYSAVEERRQEIGMLLAIGMAPRKIQQIFLMKVLMFALVGGLLGYLVGTGMSMVLGPVVADAQVAPVPHLLPLALALSLALSTVASILPVRRIARLDPVEALRVS